MSIISFARERRQEVSNPGIPLDLEWIHRLRVNRSAVDRRCSTLPGRRSVKKEWQTAWLLRALTCIDLTTLDGADTPGNVHRLCAKARNPLRQDIVERLEMADITVGAVCVYPALVERAVKALEGSRIPVASVAAGFPDGLTPMATRVDEVRRALEAGAAEIDIVVRREWILTANWEALHEEIQAFREAAGSAHLKVILGTGNLGTLTHVARASLVAMMAGADFIKTSTGRESVNATLPVSLVMVRTLRDYCRQTGNVVGFKPAGGIRKAKDSLAYLSLIREELGCRWVHNHCFRFGASGLLGDLCRQIEHSLTGRYASGRHHPMS